MFELNDLFGGALCCHLPRNAVDIRFVISFFLLKLKVNKNNVKLIM